LNEITIELTEISPQDFFGQQNSNINLLKQHFPKLKIVARGNKIKAYGDQEVLEEFDRRIAMLLEHFAKYNKLDENVIERIILSRSKADYETSISPNDVLVHGVNGRKVKPQTANQRKLVELMYKNDMVFAVGPAGTGKTYTGVALAVKALKEKQVLRIVLTSPAVDAGENIGFLPADLK
jgi:phosphate starvation-inducible PhoH-like protein